MTRKHRLQAGASVFGTILTLAVAAYAIFLGTQLVPQLIESQTLDSVLESLQEAQLSDPIESSHELESRLDSLLNLNGLDEMKKHFNIRQNGPHFVVEVAYERDLDLLFQARKLNYQKSRTLR